MKLKGIKNWLILIFLLVIIFFGAKSYWNFLQSSIDLKGETKAFIIKKGESTSEIADSLEKVGLIRSANVFKLKLKLSGQIGIIAAGDFKLSPAMSLDEIVNNLHTGTMDKWVTLIEGWRIEEEARKLSEELGVSSEEFLKLAKEGYMFPDTYLFNPKATPETIISTLENNFNQKYDKTLQDKIKSLGLSPAQGVILASIVEREARSDGVRTKVASILLKRFNLGMALDADSTVQYAKDSQKLKQGVKVKKFWQPITKDDYRSTLSSYNTYLNPGLPPGPISNPSLSSFKAVANADPSTPYLFYYHDSAGNSYYARTLEEHNNNVANHP